MNPLKYLIQLYTGATHQVWCLRCRDKKESRTVRYATTRNSTRTVKRIIGECKTCRAATSAIVG